MEDNEKLSKVANNQVLSGSYPGRQGIYTLEEHVHGHEIVIPRKVTHRGELISHNVTHHHHEYGPVVHYRLAVAGNEYHIELTAVDNFIGPGMVVERRKRDLHVRSRPKNRSSKCHYRGFIQGHPNSQVALSACDGLVQQGGLDQCFLACQSDIFP
ncbi:A disintegrin and metalloproteinase with thrombospondin motifs 16 [Eufriesea mexicana]|nr:A disintegrin and metalloproteinase with thrombospondin motifs 16 [Eufriesea mexicana]